MNLIIRLCTRVNKPTAATRLYFLDSLFSAIFSTLWLVKSMAALRPLHVTASAMLLYLKKVDTLFNGVSMKFKAQPYALSMASGSIVPWARPCDSLTYALSQSSHVSLNFALYVPLTQPYRWSKRSHVYVQSYLMMKLAVCFSQNVSR